MHFGSQKTIVLIVIVLLLVFILPSYSSGDEYERTYTFYVQDGPYKFSHSLHISVQPSLYDYYQAQSHSLSTDSGYVKFVTPDAVRSIAESLRNATSDRPDSDEQFANAVLMLVHHLKYRRSSAKYPVEVLVDNQGDCDEMSFLAASIMKAGGLDVVLLYYQDLDPNHVNVGVYLPKTPVYHTWWMPTAGYEYNGRIYWIAECTPLAEWKVGDMPELLADVKPLFISLENCEKSSPAHISSSLDKSLAPSAIFITLSSENSSVREGVCTLRISGSISPAYSGETILTYVSRNEDTAKTLRTVTDDFGNYSLTWDFASSGTYHVRTSWSGVSNCAGADSENITVFVRLSQQADEFEVPANFLGAGIIHNSSIERGASFKILDQEFLKKDLSGAGIAISGEFILLKNGNTTEISERTITIPSYEQPIFDPRHPQRWQPPITITIPEQTIRVPVYQQPLDDHLGLIMRHDGGDNYSISVSTLDDSDIAQATERVDGNNTAFMNASMTVRENSWYNVAAMISEDEVAAQLYDENSILLESMTSRDNTTSSSEFGILMSYDPNTVIAFRNLKIELLDQLKPSGEEKVYPVNGPNVLVPYISVTLILIVAATAVVYANRRKRNRYRNQSFSSKSPSYMLESFYHF